MNAGVDDAIREADEVLRLGQKLFADNRGRLANYPHYDMEKDEYPENVPLVSQSDLLDDPEDPQRLVLHLQATAGGCQWMLDRWAELRLILEEGLDWQSADKFKAVRLLGRHPIEAVDDRNVLMIFATCQAIESQPSLPIPEIWNELREYERMPYAQRLVGRGIEKLRPKDAAAARQALYAVIDRATAQIAAKAEVHRMRAEINDSLAADRLAFDDTPEAERLRRFDLACGRGMARSLDSLLKLRRAPELADCPSSVIAVPSSADGEAVESSGTAYATIEPMVACESVTNEATDACEIVTNEPADASEPAAGFENMTNEATTDHENPTDEPTAQVQNVTNEPTLAALGEDNRGVVTLAGMNDVDDSDFHEEIDRQKSDKWNHARVARVSLRAEKQRALNDECRREAQAANAGRLSRLDWNASGKSADLQAKRGAGAKPRRTETDTARTVGTLAQLVSAGLGLTVLD